MSEKDRGDQVTELVRSSIRQINEVMKVSNQTIDDLYKDNPEIIEQVKWMMQNRVFGCYFPKFYKVSPFDFILAKPVQVNDIATSSPSSTSEEKK